MLEQGYKLGGVYTVLHDLGKGGTSHVYLVLNERAGRQWAAKEIAKDGGGEVGVIKKGLVTDAEVLKKLHHPGIPGIVDIIETKDMYYILMEYIEGMTLEQILKDEGEQEQDICVEWSKQLCDVLIYLHSQEPKIIYRDMKPSNVMITPEGKAVLIDFGAAREYKPASVEDTVNLGTRGFAAPEQLLGSSQSDERTDIYNLGVTMYYMLTGHNPSHYPYDIYPIRHWKEELSPGLENIVLKCTKANPEERYQSAAELKYDLEHYEELDSNHAKRKKLVKIFAYAAGILGVLLIAGSIYAGILADSVKNDNYDSLINAAEYATTKEKQIELYSEAVALEPQSVTAYENLLQRVFLEDGNFTSEESEIMSELLNTTNGQKTNVQLMSRSEDYPAFAYELGIAYFYYYEESGNKPMSETWLKTAAESGSLTEARTERALILSKIAGYYAQIGQKNLAGDPEVSYADYWNDLDELTKDNIVSIDNAKTALVTYREISYQLRMHAVDFKKAGVTEEAMLQKIDDINEHLSEDFEGIAMEEYTDITDNIAENLEAAVSSIEIAFEGQEG